jgi:dephospho-CoA kinase
MTVSDIPLLCEAGRQHCYDRTLLVTAPLWLRKRRAFDRTGMTEEKWETLLAHQWSDHRKRICVQGVILTGGGYAETARQINRIYRGLYASHRV